MSGSGEQAAGRVVAGRYRLEGRLGQGGMGIVWLAVDTLIERQVALKEVRTPTADEESSFLERALREARNAGRLNHPGVVAVHDVIAPSGTDDAIYIVMEYVQAPTLAAIIDESGPLPAARVAAMGVGILDALMAAHSMGIVHRDVKPSNVLVAEGDRVKLTDFGIALAAEDARLTRSGVMGTHAYMAPECFEGGQVGPAADLWALGATLFHAVAGRAPFERDTTTATLRAILFDDPPAPPCGPPLGDVITRLLTRPVGERLTSDTAREQLQHIVDTLPAAGPQPAADAAPWEAQATTAHRPPTATPPPAQPWGQPTGAGTPSTPATPQPTPFASGPPTQSPTGQAWPTSGPNLPQQPAHTTGPVTGPAYGPMSPGHTPPGRNTTPFLIGGIVAAGAALLLVVLLIASGGDDDNGGSGGGGGYTDAMRENFIQECSSQAGDAASACECAWDEITATVPVDVYQEFEATFAEDPANAEIPDEIFDAIATCTESTPSPSA